MWKMVRFNKRLYSKKSVVAAMAAYAELADFKLLENKSEWLVEIRSMDKDVADFFEDEFCNYVLSLVKT